MTHFKYIKNYVIQRGEPDVPLYKPTQELSQKKSTTALKFGIEVAVMMNRNCDETAAFPPKTVICRHLPFLAEQAFF